MFLLASIWLPLLCSWRTHVQWIRLQSLLRRPQNLLRRPQNSKTISHSDLMFTFMSNRSRRLFQILWPSQNIVKLQVIRRITRKSTFCQKVTVHEASWVENLKHSENASMCFKMRWASNSDYTVIWIYVISATTVLKFGLMRMHTGLERSHSRVFC